MSFIQPYIKWIVWGITGSILFSALLSDAIEKTIRVDSREIPLLWINHMMTFVFLAIPTTFCVFDKAYATFPRILHLILSLTLLWGFILFLYLIIVDLSTYRIRGDTRSLVNQLLEITVIVCGIACFMILFVGESFHALCRFIVDNNESRDIYLFAKAKKQFYTIFFFLSLLLISSVYLCVPLRITTIQWHGEEIPGRIENVTVQVNGTNMIETVVYEAYDIHISVLEMTRALLTIGVLFHYIFTGLFYILMKMDEHLFFPRYTVLTLEMGFLLILLTGVTVICILDIMQPYYIPAHYRMREDGQVSGFSATYNTPSEINLGFISFYACVNLLLILVYFRYIGAYAHDHIQREWRIGKYLHYRYKHTDNEEDVDVEMGGASTS
jgi:hypothetical protein